MATGLKFRIEEVEGLHYLCSENKGADQLHGFHAADFGLCFFLAHLSRRLIGELIVYPWSGVRRTSSVRRRRRPQCSNIFFSETPWPIKAKFYVEPPWVGGTIFLFAASGSHDQDGRHAHIW